MSEVLSPPRLLAATFYIPDSDALYRDACYLPANESSEAGNSYGITLRAPETVADHIIQVDTATRGARQITVLGIEFGSTTHESSDPRRAIAIRRAYDTHPLQANVRLPADEVPSQSQTQRLFHKALSIGSVILVKSDHTNHWDIYASERRPCILRNSAVALHEKALREFGKTIIRYAYKRKLQRDHPAPPPVDFIDRELISSF